MFEGLSDRVVISRDGQLQRESITFIVSPSCGACIHTVPVINELAQPSFLAKYGIAHYKIVVVDVNNNFHSLRSQGIEVDHVPTIVIKSSSDTLTVYPDTKQRMATEIAQAAADVLKAGAVPVVEAVVPAAEPAPLAAGATEAVADALLGGAAAAPAADLAAGAKKRGRKGAKKSKSRGSKKSRQSKKSKKSKGRKSHKRMHGGAEPASLEAGEIEGGAKKASKKRSRSKSRSKKQTAWMKAVMAQYAKGKKSRKSYTLKQAMKSAKRTYRSRSRK